MTRAWDKEKSESPTRIEPTTSRTPGGRSIHWPTRTEFICDRCPAYCYDQHAEFIMSSDKWIKMVNLESKVILLSSYVTGYLHTARISTHTAYCQDQHAVNEDGEFLSSVIKREIWDIQHDMSVGQREIWKKSEKSHDLPNTGRALYPLSYENSWRARSFYWVHMWQVSCILLAYC